MMYKTRYIVQILTSMVSNYFVKSCTACGKTIQKENLKLSQDHLNIDTLKPQCKVS